MKKTSYIRLIALCAAVVIAATGFSVHYFRRAVYYKQQLENEYSYALYELNSGLNSISETLEKSRYVTDTAYMSEIAANLYTKAEISKNALSRLPSDVPCETVWRFLSQVGNYSLALAKNAINGRSVTTEQTENLELLAQAAQTIALAVGDTELNFNNHQYWAQEIESKLESSPLEGESLASSLSSIEESLTDYPTLIYDGPFSEHIINAEPLFIKDAKTVSSETARQLAQSVAPQAGQLGYSHIVNGEIALHLFSQENITLAVSELGGHLVYMLKSRDVASQTLKFEQAVSKARLFLNQVGLKDMGETYYFTDNGICVINFAYINNGITYYTDLVKVGVALDNGEILFYEASGYIYNHTARAVTEPLYSQEQAGESIRSELAAQYSKLAVIPTTDGEKQCFEFTCTDENGNEILIYINTQNLKEENILILLKTDGGTLVLQ